ncbi:hypothetical protein KIH86_11960 [Paenibacillus sp. HN-1]|uniref:hypothetical protein n=1 Tax=Paenibacillus TaxID=44249 RepID=UPI001CA8218F|nr:MULTISPECIES: hypothetical protein [Paenibacillus]MBY9081417.1 hypothetical protein [Paenibacillus sp. CGMCC 1.18879]MBY9084937.1 hypothetical protein [Paenibacillus sinensis]
MEQIVGGIVDNVQETLTGEGDHPSHPSGYNDQEEAMKQPQPSAANRRHIPGCL